MNIGPLKKLFLSRSPEEQCLMIGIVVFLALCFLFFIVYIEPNLDKKKSNTKK